MQQSLPDWRRFAAPSIVYLITVAVSLTFSIVGGREGSDIMTNIHITGTLAQILIDLPAVALFIYLRMDREWGSGLRQHLIGAAVGLVLAALTIGIKFFAGGAEQIVFMRYVPAFTQSLAQASPWNILWATAALLAYGPGEALWVVYFMLAFDRLLATTEKPSWLTWGVLIGALLWALPHLLNAPFHGLASALANAVKILVLGLLMGMALRGSKSWVAPAVYWMLTNGTP